MKNSRFDLADDEPPPPFLVRCRRRVRAFFETPLDPDSPVALRWDLLIVACTLYSLFATPFALSFGAATDSQTAALSYTDFIIDILFMTDLLVRMRTAYVNKHGDLETRALPILRRYARGWLALDIVSSIPVEVILIGISGFNNLDSGNQTLLLLRLVRFMRLLRFGRLFQFGRRFRFTSSMRLMRLVLSFLLLVHASACLFHSVPYIEATVLGIDTSNGLDPTTASWLRSANLLGADRSSLYIASLYWSIMTCITLGYGDIVPVTPVERTFVIFYMIGGTAVYSMIFASLTALLASMNTAEGAYHSFLDQIEGYMEAHQFAPNLQERVLAFYDYRFSQQQQQFRGGGGSLFNDLPVLLQTQVAAAAHARMLSLNPVFRDAPANLCQLIAMKLRQQVSVPGEVLFSQGEGAGDLYFVGRGEVALVVRVNEAEASARGRRRARRRRRLRRLLGLRRGGEDDGGGDSGRGGGPLVPPGLSLGPAALPPPLLPAGEGEGEGADTTDGTSSGGRANNSSTEIASAGRSPPLRPAAAAATAAATAAARRRWATVRSAVFTAILHARHGSPSSSVHASMRSVMAQWRGRRGSGAGALVGTGVEPLVGQQAAAAATQQSLPRALPSVFSFVALGVQMRSAFRGALGGGGAGDGEELDRLLLSPASPHRGAVGSDRNGAAVGADGLPMPTVSARRHANNIHAAVLSAASARALAHRSRDALRIFADAAGAAGPSTRPPPSRPLLAVPSFGVAAAAASRGSDNKDPRRRYLPDQGTSPLSSSSPVGLGSQVLLDGAAATGGLNTRSRGGRSPLLNPVSLASPSPSPLRPPGLASGTMSTTALRALINSGTAAARVLLTQRAGGRPGASVRALASDSTAGAALAASGQPDDRRFILAASGQARPGRAPSSNPSLPASSGAHGQIFTWAEEGGDELGYRGSASNASAAVDGVTDIAGSATRAVESGVEMPPFARQKRTSNASASALVRAAASFIAPSPPQQAISEDPGVTALGRTAAAPMMAAEEAAPAAGHLPGMPLSSKPVDAPEPPHHRPRRTTLAALNVALQDFAATQAEDAAAAPVSVVVVDAAAGGGVAAPALSPRRPAMTAGSEVASGPLTHVTLSVHTAASAGGSGVDLLATAVGAAASTAELRPRGGGHRHHVTRPATSGVHPPPEASFRRRQMLLEEGDPAAGSAALEHMSNAVLTKLLQGKRGGIASVLEASQAAVGTTTRGHVTDPSLHTGGRDAMHRMRSRESDSRRGSSRRSSRSSSSSSSRSTPPHNKPVYRSRSSSSHSSSASTSSSCSRSSSHRRHHHRRHRTAHSRSRHWRHERHHHHHGHSHATSRVPPQHHHRQRHQLQPTPSADARADSHVADAAPLIDKMRPSRDDIIVAGAVVPSSLNKAPSFRGQRKPPQLADASPRPPLNAADHSSLVDAIPTTAAFIDDEVVGLSGASARQQQREATTSSVPAAGGPERSNTSDNAVARISRARAIDRSRRQSLRSIASRASVVTSTGRRQQQQQRGFIADGGGSGHSRSSRRGAVGVAASPRGGGGVPTSWRQEHEHARAVTALSGAMGDDEVVLSWRREGAHFGEEGMLAGRPARHQPQALRQVRAQLLAARDTLLGLRRRLAAAEAVQPKQPGVSATGKLRHHNGPSAAAAAAGDARDDALSSSGWALLDDDDDEASGSNYGSSEDDEAGDDDGSASSGTSSGTGSAGVPASNSRSARSGGGGGAASSSSSSSRGGGGGGGSLSAAAGRVLRVPGVMRGGGAGALQVVSAHASTFCELYLLPAEDLAVLLELFPAECMAMQWLARRRRHRAAACAMYDDVGLGGALDGALEGLVARWGAQLQRGQAQLAAVHRRIVAAQAALEADAQAGVGGAAAPQRA